MKGGAGRFVYGFSSTERTEKSAPLEPVGQPERILLGQLPRLALQPAVGAEVASLRDPRAVDRHQPGREVTRVERALDVPVGGGDEGHPLALAFDDEAGCDGLDATGRQPRHHLLPEDGRDLVAVEPVEDAPRLLRVDQRLVHGARVGERLLDRALGDLVEDHPARRHLRLELLEEMPGDRLALAVLVCRQQQLVGVLQLALQVGDHALLVRVDHVVGLEPVVDRDAERAVPLPFVLRDVRRTLRQVADVADAGLDDEPGAEIAGDCLRLGGRLDDDEFVGHVGRTR